MSNANEKNAAVAKPKRQWDIASIIVAVGALVVTLLLIGLLIYNVAKPFKYTKYEDLNPVVYEDYKTQDEEEYYVFVLDNGSKKAPWLENVVVEYANYARTHSNAKSIYLYDYRASGNSAIINDLNISTNASSKLPGLFLVKKGSVSTKYLSYAEASNELTKAMGR